MSPGYRPCAVLARTAPVRGNRTPHLGPGGRSSGRGADPGAWAAAAWLHRLWRTQLAGGDQHPPSLLSLSGPLRDSRPAAGLCCVRVSLRPVGLETELVLMAHAVRRCVLLGHSPLPRRGTKIGRASCRERGEV